MRVSLPARDRDQRGGARLQLALSNLLDPSHTFSRVCGYRRRSAPTRPRSLRHSPTYLCFSRAARRARPWRRRSSCCAGGWPSGGGSSATSTPSRPRPTRCGAPVGRPSLGWHARQPVRHLLPRLRWRRAGATLPLRKRRGPRHPALLHPGPMPLAAAPGRRRGARARLSQPQRLHRRARLGRRSTWSGLG